MVKAQVIGGTVNGNGALTIRVTKVGGDTALAGIMKLVAEAQSSKSKTQILADKAAFYLTFVALGAAVVTGIAWAIAGKDAAFILERIVTVLVIACPHALGLAVPLVTAISTTLAAKNGLLIRQRMALETAKDGKTEVYLVKEDAVIGALALADEIREESRETIAALKEIGITSAMITGDSRDVAAYVARELGLDQFFAEVHPEDKAAKVKELQATGQRVAMVGDGVNDAPALVRADVGIAIGAGTDVAIESAGIVLVSSDPRSVAKVIKLSKVTYRKMLQNLGWATGYNALAIPLAAGVTAALGFVLSPAFGAVLMSLSTIIVALNAQLLRRAKL